MIAKIKFFKSSRGFVYFLLVFALVFNAFGFSFKENKLIPFLKDKIKAKINYRVGPNNPDFFRDTDLEKYTDLGSLNKLGDVWAGTYDLNKESVFWLNPKLDKKKIFNLIDFKLYNLFLKFNFLENKKRLILEISQEGIEYVSVNMEIVNNKQINYWAQASSKSWKEVIRGKVLRLNENELYTIFQTTVYEEKIPIYAFQGKVVLRRT